MTYKFEEGDLVQVEPEDNTQLIPGINYSEDEHDWGNLLGKVTFVWGPLLTDYSLIEVEFLEPPKPSLRTATIYDYNLRKISKLEKKLIEHGKI